MAGADGYHSGMQPRAVQGMLDFDFICKRSTPSVAGIIYTFGGQFVSKMYEDPLHLLPIFPSTAADYGIVGTGVPARLSFLSTRMRPRPWPSTLTLTPL
jgi:hypothetical protein